MNSNLEMFQLTGKTAIVTGAGSGLGKAIAQAYAYAGAAVALIDIDAENAKAVSKEIVQNGGNAYSIKCDIKNEEDVRLSVQEVINHYGKIDILVNNAGIGKRSMAEEMTLQDWDLVLDVNLRGTFMLTQSVGRHMIERGKGGRIINMASITALVGVETGNVNYAASKGAIVAMSRCLALEWAKHDILVNVIAPTHIRTPLVENLIKEKPETEAYFLNNIPLGRLGEVEDIIGPAVFLASDAAGFITGHTLLVDGGHTAK